MKRTQLLKQIDTTVENIYSYIDDKHKQMYSTYSVTLPQGHMIMYTHNMSLFGEIKPYTKLMFIRNSGELTTYAYGLSLLTLEDQVMYDTNQCDDPNAELQFLKLFEAHLEQGVL